MRCKGFKTETDAGPLGFPWEEVSLSKNAKADHTIAPMILPVSPNVSAQQYNRQQLTVRNMIQ